MNFLPDLATSTPLWLAMTTVGVNAIVADPFLVGAELGRQDTQNFRETGYFGAPGSTQTSETVSIGNPLPTLPICSRRLRWTARQSSRCVD